MPIIFFIIAILIRNWRRKARLEESPAAAPAIPLSADLQWSKLVGIVSTSIDQTAVTRRYHTAAEDQLDAAAYALKELIKDLSAVMTVPAARSGAALYQLPVPAVNAASSLRRRASAA